MRRVWLGSSLILLLGSPSAVMSQTVRDATRTLLDEYGVVAAPGVPVVCPNLGQLNAIVLTVEGLSARHPGEVAPAVAGTLRANLSILVGKCPKVAPAPCARLGSMARVRLPGMQPGVDGKRLPVLALADAYIPLSARSEFHAALDAETRSELLSWQAEHSSLVAALNETAAVSAAKAKWIQGLWDGKVGDHENQVSKLLDPDAKGRTQTPKQKAVRSPLQ